MQESRKPEASVDVETSSIIADLWGDGTFPPNPPIADGGFFHGVLRKKDRVGFVTIDPGIEVLDAASEAEFRLAQLSRGATVCRKRPSGSGDRRPCGGTTTARVPAVNCGPPNSIWPWYAPGSWLQSSSSTSVTPSWPTP